MLKFNQVKKIAGLIAAMTLVLAANAGGSTTRQFVDTDSDFAPADAGCVLKCADGACDQRVVHKVDSCVDGKNMIEYSVSPDGESVITKPVDCRTWCNDPAQGSFDLADCETEVVAACGATPVAWCYCWDS